MSEPEYTNSEQIMAYQMPAFFEELHEKYEGKRVNVERDGDLIYRGPINDWVTLKRVRYYDVRTGKALYVDTEHDGAEEQYTMKVPTIVWTVYDQQRQIVAVQVIDDQGRNIIFRFEP